MTPPRRISTNPTNLPRAIDRWTFITLERCRIKRRNNGIVAVDQTGTIELPVAQLSTILLGPGTSITHDAAMILAESGVTLCWMGSHNIRYYSNGTPTSNSTYWLELQAKTVTNKTARTNAAKRMYHMRFGQNTNIDKLSIAALRGKEGTRVKQEYKRLAALYNIRWTTRQYSIKHPDQADEPNLAISIATSCLYATTQAVIVAMGMSPGLGIIHTGDVRSWVFDIADLYKTTIAVPMAFDAVSHIQDHQSLPSLVRTKMWHQMNDCKLLRRIPNDIAMVLTGDADTFINTEISTGDLLLWDPDDVKVAGGVSYTEDG